MAQRFPMGSVGPDGLHRGMASAGRCLGGVQHTVAIWRRAPHGELWGPIPLHPLRPLPPLQWLDCSPVYTEARLGCVDHHDGGGWLLHPLCRALTLPPEAGEWWVLGQLQTQGSRHLSPAFSMGVFITTAVGPPVSSKVQQLPPRFWVGGQAGWGLWWLPWEYNLDDLVPGGPQGGAFLTTASFRRCTPCTAGRGPASSRPKRSFPRASSVTGPSAAPPHLLPEEPSRGISPPDSLFLCPGLFSHLPSELHFPWVP